MNQVVIASEAKQSRPDVDSPGRDCFVATLLAMTTCIMNLTVIASGAKQSRAASRTRIEIASSLRSSQ
jgi:hypothetical protein